LDFNKKQREAKRLLKVNFSTMNILNELDKTAADEAELAKKD